MQTIVKLYSIVPNEIERFLKHFFKNDEFQLNENCKQWQKSYPNPIEMADIIGTYVENIDDYNLTMWVSLDSGVFIKVTQDNSDELIRYLYERFPY